MKNYLDRRDEEIDRSEWLDIIWALRYLMRIHPEKRSGVIIELCAGKGYLTELLDRKFPRYVVFGYDIEGYKYSNYVFRLDLEETRPSPATYYVFQHCLEHISQNRVVDLLSYMALVSRGIVGVLPGHMLRDPTHKVNHYHLNDVHRIMKKVSERIGQDKNIYYCVRPDIHSYIYPSDLDYLLVITDRRVECKHTLPPWFRMFLKINRRLIAFEKRQVA